MRHISSSVTLGGKMRRKSRRRQSKHNSDLLSWYANVANPSKHPKRKSSFRTQRFHTQKYTQPVSHLFIIHADWCGACKQSIDEFKKLAAKHPHRVHLFEQKGPGVEQRFHPKSFPTIFRSLNASGVGRRTDFSGERTVEEMEKFLFR